MIRKKVIQVPPSSVDKLAAVHDCNRSTVYSALAFNSNSEQARAIRQDALDNHGGVITSKIIL